MEEMKREDFDPSLFHPWDSKCKAPFGAVAAGESVKLSVHPPRSLGFVQASVTFRFEQWEDREETYPLIWQDTALGVDTFSADIPVPADYQGLIWYSFRLDFSTPPYLKISQEYQLTVYDGSETVPTWFGDGMCYQIFPDRFCRLELPRGLGPGDRWVHENWSDHPVWQPDENGEITNRDFFGGSLAGVESKLDYLADLGVETIYFCPIFEALENHRYGKADYEKIDPMLGSEKDFERLCRKAHAKGIHVILDGVFNHVGWASKYFNATGVYGDGGAARDEHSPYHDWFLWEHWPDQYKSWWGFKTLPDFNKTNPDFLNFLCGEKGVIRSWLRRGADGWRLDVADELPDEMVHALHAAARAEKKDGLIIGEVWEDGSIKMAYDVRRKHVWGGHCDGLMNYPLRNALISFLLGGDAQQFMLDMETIREHYPPFAFHNAMNSLGTHDTLRILTFLGTGSDHRGDWSREQRANYTMTEEEYRQGVWRLKLGLALLFAFPGAPTVYYGDEAGVTGFEDPFNRKPFPWGSEDKDLQGFVAKLGRLRKTVPALRRGEIAYLAADKGLLAFSRTLDGETVIAAANRGDRGAHLELSFPCVDALTGECFPQRAYIPAQRAVLLQKAP